jgi:alanine racemase
MPKTESLSRPALVEIHMDRVLHNLQYLQSKTLHPFFCPMIKADAYGHGDAVIANHMQKNGIKVVGVSTLDEAIHLRQSGYKKDILTFSPFFQSCLKEVLKFKLTPVLSEMNHLQAFKNLKQPLNVHFKVNTGMNRMGFDMPEIENAVEKCKKQGLQIVGLATHLLDSSDPNGHTVKQIKAFEEIKTKFFSKNLISHVYNSDGLLQAEKPIYGARPGIAVYGYASGDNHKLKPVMELKAKIVALRTVKKGEVVSYGARWTAAKDSVVAVLPLGYADGLSRSLTNNIEFLLGKSKVPQVGTICMDYTMVDVTGVKAEVGSTIQLFGAQIGMTAKDMGKKIGTIPYEILTSVSERIPRVYIE